MRDVSTSLDMTRGLLQGRRTVWIVAAITIFLFLIANLPWQLDDYDQAKQAFTSFEIIKEGHWFYQRTPQEYVATKPPLVGWISAGLFSLTRSWDVAWRLPSLLAAIAISVLLFRTASLVYGTVAGLIALSAFGLNLLSLRLATLVRTDMPLAFVIFLIGFLIWRKIQKEEAWKPRDRVYIFVLLTAAMLIKGPIVYAFLLPGIAIIQWWHRRHVPSLPPEESVGSADKHDCSHGAVSPCGGSRGERLDTARRLQGAWFGWWPWLASLGVFLVWVIGGILFQPGFFDQVVMREFIGRFGETIHRPQSLYFYLAHLLHKFAPWSVLMIALAVADLHSRKWQLRSVFRDMSPETFWLLCWSMGGLLAMSLIPSKRVDRIFPIIPPLCLLLAAQIGNRYAASSHGTVSRSSMSLDVDLTRLRRVATEDEGMRMRFCRWSAVALLWSIVLTGGYTISKVVSGYRDHRDALVLFGRAVRHEAEAHHWRYEVLSAKDEGLLLYLEKTHFINLHRAVVQWNRGNLDALVAPTEDAAALMRKLHDAALSQLKSNERREGQGRSYVLITR
jgi:4-amino-4-deoxy-L-arabinose transferase-like glycosyltransferase